MSRAILLLAALLLAPLATADTAAQAQQVPNPMARDAANAQNPEAATNLGLGAASDVNHGTLWVNKFLTYPAAPVSRIYGSGGVYGTTTGTGVHAAYMLNIDADDADCTSSNGCNGSYFGHSLGGSTLKGNRTTLGVFTNFVEPSGNTAGNWWYTALGSGIQASAHDGGTPAVPRGNIFAANFIATLKPAAVNMNALAGLEIDVTAETGSSVAYKSGLTIVQFDGDVRGNVEDLAFGIANGGAATAGWLYGISFGMRAGQWPMAPAGTLIGTNPSLAAPGVPYATANGVDFRQVTFSGSAFASPGFGVSGAGAARVTGLSVEDPRALAAGIGGTIALKGVNGAGAQVPYGGIRASATGGVPGDEAGDVFVQVAGGGILHDFARFDIFGGFSAAGGIMAGSVTPLALGPGEIGMTRISGTGAPGAAGGKLAFVCGTTAGTAKLVAYAGTSATPVTVVDNIGAGVSGC